MIKFLIGGSPCTHWSIAQSKNRETTAEGIGWELFKNYLIARNKFKPNFFLYENNKSASPAIKDQIKIELGVNDGTLFGRGDGRYIEINSALISAQNRRRFYVHNFGDVPQPHDRRILLQDILESGQSWIEKAYTLTTSCGNAVAHDTLKKKRHTMIAEPIIIRCPLPFECAELDTEYFKGGFEGGLIGQIVNSGTYKNGKQPSQQYRVYTADGKSVCVDRDARKYYACPLSLGTAFADKEKAECFRATYDKCGTRNFEENIIRSKGYEGILVFVDRLGAINEPLFLETPNGRKTPIYRVEGRHIAIKGAEYPINLPNGYYIIRKLTVTEACRLQTLPDDYCRAVSAAQAYKGLGNGWTAEVIIYLLSYALAGVPKDEEIVVLSMYDGIGTGRYCFDKLGYRNVKYFAYETDKYAMQIAQSNFPDILQCGDAFQVREDGWKLKHEGTIYDYDARDRYKRAVNA